MWATWFRRPQGAQQPQQNYEALNDYSPRAEEAAGRSPLGGSSPTNSQGAAAALPTRADRLPSTQLEPATQEQHQEERDVGEEGAEEAGAEAGSSQQQQAPPPRVLNIYAIPLFADQLVFLPAKTWSEEDGLEEQEEAAEAAAATAGIAAIANGGAPGITGSSRSGRSSSCPGQEPACRASDIAGAARLSDGGAPSARSSTDGGSGADGGGGNGSRPRPNGGGKSRSGLAGLQQRLVKQWRTLGEGRPGSLGKRIHTIGTNIIENQTPEERLMRNIPDRVTKVVIYHPSGYDPQALQRQLADMAQRQGRTGVVSGCALPGQGRAGRRKRHR